MHLFWPPTQGKQQVYIRDILDGDTVRVFFLTPQDVRLFGVNAPEVKGPEKVRGVASRLALLGALPVGTLQMVDLRGEDKYFGRVLGEFLDPQGQSVNQMLLREGLALPYDGKGPKPV